MATRSQRMLLLVAIALLPSQLRAADPPKSNETALNKAPADAEYYRSTLRLGETIGIVAKSQAWKLIWEEPAVQELRKKAFAELAKDDLAPVRKFLADPANAEVPALALDAFSHETFIYSGAGSGDMLAMLQELMSVARFGPALQQLQGRGGDQSRASVRMILQLLSEKPERLRIPDLMAGFKLSEPAKVAGQLQRIEPVIKENLKETPLKDSVRKVKIGDDEFTVLTLDGSLVPWDDVPIDKYEDKDGEFAPLIKHLKGMKLSIAIGVRQGYLLFAIGQSTDAILKFGGNGAKLADRPELKPLAKAAEKPLVAQGYVSAKLRQAVATTPEDIQGTADLLKSLIPLAALPDDLEKSLEKDIDSGAQGIIKGLVKPEAAFSYSFRTPRGWESFDYDLTPTGAFSTKPLTLLNHVGGNPILAAVWRSETTEEDYRGQVKWLTIVGDYAEKIVRSKKPDAEPILDKIRDQLYPLLREFNDTTEKLWLPALADGQNGIVMDAKWKTKQWHEVLKTDRELPVPEFGIILGVSDADKLGQALEGYRLTANKLIAKVRENVPPDTIPEFEIPKPKLDEKNGRKYAFYSLAKEWGFDKMLEPTGGVGGSVAALALSRGHVDRLLSPTPLPGNLAPLADPKKPIDSAFVFNFAELMAAAEPWVTYAIEKSPPADKKEAERIAPKVLSILKVFQCYSTATWREHGTTITHSETVLQDVPSGK